MAISGLDTGDQAELAEAVERAEQIPEAAHGDCQRLARPAKKARDAVKKKGKGETYRGMGLTPQG